MTQIDAIYDQHWTSLSVNMSSWKNLSIISLKFQIDFKEEKICFLLDQTFGGGRFHRPLFPHDVYDSKAWNNDIIAITSLTEVGHISTVDEPSLQISLLTGVDNKYNRSGLLSLRVYLCRSRSRDWLNAVRENIFYRPTHNKRLLNLWVDVYFTRKVDTLLLLFHLSDILRYVLFLISFVRNYANICILNC